GVQRVQLFCVGARAQQLHELPVGVRPEDQPLLIAVGGEAMVEQLAASLAPEGAPVATLEGGEAVEGGNHVEGVSRGHSLSCAVIGSGTQTANHDETHRRWTREVGPRACRAKTIAEVGASQTP